jgi:5-methylcytosine-specific restriction endonuclease McrA
MPIRPPKFRPPGWKARVPWQKQTTLPQPQHRDLPDDWPDRRRRVLAEEPYCRYCWDERKARVKSTTVDHMVPRFKGGGHERSNLAGCCETCQRSKAGREGNEAQRSV